MSVPACLDHLMEEQRDLGMFGLHNLAWHPDLVEAACNTHGLDLKNKEGEFMVRYGTVHDNHVYCGNCNHSAGLLRVCCPKFFA